MRPPSIQVQYHLLEEVKRIISSLTQQDHSKINQKANYWYAYYRLRRTFCSRDPVDFSQDAIRKLLDGTRNAPVEIRMTQTICFILKSDIGHTARKRSLVNVIPDPDIEMYSKEAAIFDKMHFDDLIAIFEMAAQEIKHGQAYLDLLRQDPELKPRDIAFLLGIREQDVYALKRKLKNRLKN